MNKVMTTLCCAGLVLTSCFPLVTVQAVTTTDQQQNPDASAQVLLESGIPKELQAVPETSGIQSTPSETSSTQETSPTSNDDSKEVTSETTEKSEAEATTESSSEEATAEKEKTLEKSTRALPDDHVLVVGTEIDETLAEALVASYPSNANKQEDPTKGPKPQAGVVIEEEPDTIVLNYNWGVNRADEINRGASPWSGTGKVKNQLTVGDMKAIKTLNLNALSISPVGKKITSLKGLEYAENLSWLNVAARSMNLSDDDPNQNDITTIDISSFPKLKGLNLEGNKNISSIDVTGNPELTYLNVAYLNQITDLNVTQNPELQYLVIDNLSLMTLDVSQNPELLLLYANRLPVTEISLINNKKLKDMRITNSTTLRSVDLSECKELTNLRLNNNKLLELNIDNNKKLEYLYFVGCDLGLKGQKTIDLSDYNSLKYVQGNGNQLEEVLLPLNNKGLEVVYFHNNNLKDIVLPPVIDVTEDMVNLQVNFNFSRNQICDIKKIMANTTIKVPANKAIVVNFSNQALTIPTPPITSGNATVDILKTTASAGLTATNGTIIPTPGFSTEGDKIHLNNVTKESLAGNSLKFDYDKNKLTDGNFIGSTNITRSFSGTITFVQADPADLKTEITPEVVKVKSGNNVKWTWKTTGLTDAAAQEVATKLGDLPTGLTVIPGSVKVNGTPASDDVLTGTMNLGNLTKDQVIEITFETTVVGDPEEWLTLDGAVTWKDDAVTNPYTKTASGSVQVQDDEQTYKPEPSKSLYLLSVPRTFNFGVKNVEKMEKVYHMSPSDYQSNTHVDSKGFYTRVNDQRNANNNWALHASLSNFENSAGKVMPNSTGTYLKLAGLKTEKVTDYDTPKESITDAASTDPSAVSEKALVTGDSAVQIMTASNTSGAGVWQLRMPFDEISLHLPANAGEKNQNYQAQLTWSLNDTP